MDTNVTAESTATEQIVLIQIDPTTAVLGVNVRSEANLTADFVASIRELGVLEPVVGHYNQQGQFVVLRDSAAPSPPSRPSRPPSPLWSSLGPRTPTGSCSRWPRTTTAPT